METIMFGNTGAKKALIALMVGVTAIALMGAFAFSGISEATGTFGYTPECTIEPKEGRTIVDFKKNGEYTRLVVDGQTTSFDRGVSIPAGTYRILAESYDGYDGRASTEVKGQTNEQWNLALKGSSGTLATFGPTTDLKDGVDEARTITELASGAVINTAITKLTVTHAFINLAPKPHSVVPVCVAFDKKGEEVQKPSCDFILDKKYVNKGEKVTLTWKSTNATSAYINQTIAGSIVEKPGFVGVNDSQEFTINENTYFYGLFKNAKGDKVECMEDVYVKEVPKEPSCDMWADETVIQKGASTKIHWTSVHTKSHTLAPGFGNESLNGSQTVKPSDTTTYTGTFKDDKGKEVKCSVTIKVKESPKPASCEMFSVHEYPNYLPVGDTTKVTWSTTNASNIPGGYMKVKEKAPLTDVFMQPFSGIIYKEYTQKFGLNDELSVTPTRDTDYVGYLYDKNDILVDSCLVEIDIKKKEKETSCDAMALYINGSNRGKSHTINRGENVKIELEWETSNASRVTLNGTSVSNDAVGSSKHSVGTFPVNSSMSWDLEVYDQNQNKITENCKVELKVQDPVCVINCGGMNQPRVELTQKYQPATSSPLAFVSLTQVPYTGFEAGPLMTIAFWTIVALWSIVVGYSLMTRGVWQRVMASFIPSPYAPEFASPVYVGAPSRGSIDSVQEEYASTFAASRGIPPMNLPGSDAPSPLFGAPEQRPAGFKEVHVETPARDTVTAMIEDAAYAEKILVSLEAVGAIADMANRSPEAVPDVMKNVIEKAKANFSRVDGWIHLTRERVMELFPAAAPQRPSAPVFQPAAEMPKVAPVMHQYEAPRAYIAPAAQPVTNTDPAAFIAWITSGAEEQAFKAMRAHLAAGGSVQSLFADVAAAVDGAYRSRIEGGPADRRVVERFQGWTPEQMEGLLGILSGGLDYSYTTPQTAGKITLAKLFEFARTRQAR